MKMSDPQHIAAILPDAMRDIEKRMNRRAIKDEQMRFDFDQPTRQERVLAAIGEYMSRRPKAKHGR